MRDLVFPTTLPYLMTGLRLAAAVALILAITAEMVIGSPGLGREIVFAQSGGAVAGMYALVWSPGCSACWSTSSSACVERRTLSWHQSVRGEATA